MHVRACILPPPSIAEVVILTVAHELFRLSRAVF